MNKILKSFFITSVGIMVLTLIHHAYGALIYDEPFRLHVAFFAVPVIFVLVLTYRFYQKRPGSKTGKILFWVFFIVALVFPIGMIGLYEGGYNHLVKNILHFGGVSPEVFSRLFPPPLYEIPNNFFFEVTGISQFLMGIIGIYYLLKLRIKHEVELQEVPDVQ